MLWGLMIYLQLSSDPFSHVNHRQRVKFSEKHLLCLLKAVKNGTKEATLILLLSREYISIFLEKNGPITVHFRSKKVGTLNCKRFRAGVAFRRVCKTIKIVGKVFVY